LAEVGRRGRSSAKAPGRIIQEPESLLPPSDKLETYSEISRKPKEAAEVVDADEIVNIATV